MAVRRLHTLDFLEREGLHTLLRVLLEAVLHVGRRQLAPLDGRDVLPPDATAEGECPDALVRAALPRFGEVTFQRQIAVAGRLVGERVAQEAVRRETRELEQSNRLRESRIDDRRIPRRRARDRPASLGCLRTRGNPIRIRRRRARAVGPCGQQCDANTGGGSLFQERAAVEDMTRAALGGHLALLLYGTGRNERLQSPRVPRTMPSNDGKVKHRFCRSQRTGETGLSSCLPRKPPDLER